jgi:uncharacterized membrane protein
MAWVIPVHAAAATIALVLGGYNLRRKPKGDLVHRRIGVIWLVCMYWVVLSSFAIKQLRPGHFSWIHGLSVFTFCTLTIGLWARFTGRGRTHGRFMAGSYFGLLGAFVGAVSVPVRLIPQWTVYHPVPLSLAALGCLLTATGLIALSRRVRRPRPEPVPAGGSAV